MVEAGGSPAGGAQRRPFAVVLAGGIGSRFWPASTAQRPKQLLPLAGPRPLIAETVERAVAVAGRERVRVLAAAHLVEAFRRVLPDLDDENFLVEPDPRGTGPALAWAAWHVRDLDPDAVMVSLHADHAISPLRGFCGTLEDAVAAAEVSGRLFCIGVRPDRPETGYGYVEMGPELAPGIHEVARFVEKPDRDTAGAYVVSGRHLWNSGIFTWRADDLIEAVERWTPEVNGALPRLDAGDVEAFFAGCEPVSIDTGVMERADCVGVVAARFRWDDVGTWAALARTREPDEAGNVLTGAVQAVESSRNIAWSEDGRIVLFGVDGLVVVHSGDSTLVTRPQAAAELKRLLAEIGE